MIEKDARALVATDLSVTDNLAVVCVLNESCFPRITRDCRAFIM